LDCHFPVAESSAARAAFKTSLRAVALFEFISLLMAVAAPAGCRRHIRLAAKFQRELNDPPGRIVRGQEHTEVLVVGAGQVCLARAGGDG
jgi:hypothetical protein